MSPQRLWEALQDRFDLSSAGPVQIVAWCDFDPYGWLMPLVFAAHLERFGIATSGIVRLVKPHRFTPEERQLLAGPLSLNDTTRKLVERFMADTGGVDGEPQGLYADFFRPVERPNGVPRASRSFATRPQGPPRTGVARFQALCCHGPMVLRHRDFRWLWLGQLVSKLGSQFNYIALAWLVLQTTGSAVATGGVYLAQVLPNALFGWIAGVPVDRSDRRWLMIHADWLRGVLVLVLPVAYAYGGLSLPLIYAVTFLVSTLSLLFFAAEKSAVPLLVPPEDLTEANAWAEMTEQGGAFAGPVLAGVLLAALPSPVHLLYVDAASFLLSVFTLLAMGWRDPRQASPATAALVLQEAREGVVHLLKDPFLKVVFATAAAVNFLVAPFTVVFPILAERVLHAGSFGFGVLMTAFGGGMLAGSLAAGPLSRRFDAPLLIYGGMAWMGVFLGAMAAPTALGPAAALGFLSSLGVGPANAVMLTLVQEKTPPELQGRVFASLFGLVQVAVPLGVGLAALLLDLVGPREVLAAMGGAIVLAAGVGRLALSRAGRTG